MMKKENMQMQDTCYLRGLLPPSWLTNRMSGNTHGTGRKLEPLHASSAASPWWLRNSFVAVRGVVRCLEYVG